MKYVSYMPSRSWSRGSYDWLLGPGPRWLHCLLAQMPGESWFTLMPPFSSPFGCGPGEDIARLTRVDSHASGVLVEQAGNDIDLGLQGRQGLEARAELHCVSGTLGPPVRVVDAAAHEQGRESLGARSRQSPATGGVPQTGTDSSHGRAIVTPTPRRNVRRDACCSPAESFS